MAKSNLDLLNECDQFPYPDKDPEAYAALLSTDYYTLIWESSTATTTSAVPLGYISNPVFNALTKVPIKVKGELEVNRALRTVLAFQLPTEEERTKAVAATVNYWRENKTFKVLEGWRDELYPVYGPDGELLWNIERSAAALFGIVTYGIHMTAYTPSPESSFGMKLWIPRRAASKQTYGSMLDNTVAGGMASGEEPFECLVREAEEEASLPEEVVRKGSKQFPHVTYLYIRDDRAGGETGLIQPECQYIYDLELPAEVVPKPNDSEVQEFYLWTVEECQERLSKGEFKPNCSLIMLDFFIRHGILTEENEPDFKEIQSRLHRALEFPGPHK